jgi:hypothetical protein
MAGASIYISKIHLVFKNLGLQVYKVRKSYQAYLIASLKTKDNLTWSGDGRFEYMEHSAKFGAYSIMCHENTKIVHFGILQVNGLIAFQ